MRTIVLAIIAITLGIAGLSLSTAAADEGGGSAVVEPTGSAYRPLFVDAGIDAAPAAGPTIPVVAEPPSMLSQLKELQQRYEALKGNTDKSAKMLLWAALLAAGLKLLLSGVNLAAGKKPAKWLAWIALVLAVPIALLSYFAAGNSLFDSLVYAGAGPGAIVLHELLKVFAKKPAEATA